MRARASWIVVWCLAALVAWGVAPTAAGDAGPGDQECPDVDGPKCTVALSTGIEMAYVEVGPDDGQPVILLHGLTDSSRSWSLALEQLHQLRRDLHIYALDQRGQGDSSLPSSPVCPRTPRKCFEPEDLARDVVAFMRAERLDSATLAGHSMGSLVAQEVALHHPRRVEGLVLVATSPSGVDNPTLRDYVLPQIEGPWRRALEEQGVAWPEGAYDLTPLDADPDAVEWMKVFWDADPVAPQSLIDVIAAETARVPLGTWLGETEALLATDNTTALRHLKTPTLVLWGTQDPIFTRDADQAPMIEVLTRAARGKGSFAWKQYGEIPLPASGYQESDIGHNVQWEAPREVALDIDSFLRTGHPTDDLFHTDFPEDIQRIVTEPGAAPSVSRD